MRIQNEQTKAWLAQQTHEKNQTEYEKKKAEEIYQEALMARDKRAVELTKLEEECFKKLNQTTAQFNKTLVSLEVKLIDDWSCQLMAIKFSGGGKRSQEKRKTNEGGYG